MSDNFSTSVEKLSTSIEKLSTSVEKLSTSVEKLSTFIEKFKSHNDKGSSSQCETDLCNSIDRAFSALEGAPKEPPDIRKDDILFIKMEGRCPHEETDMALSKMFKMRMKNEHMKSFFESEYFVNDGTEEEPNFVSVNPRKGKTWEPIGFKVEYGFAGDTNVYVVSIIGRLDSVMIDLGNAFLMPRGFRVIIYANDNELKMRVSGFLPKFGNLMDRNVPIVADDSPLHGAVKSITFTEKMSGFLGMACALLINGKVYWLISSKNACTNEYSEWACELICPYLASPLGQVAVLEGMTLCFEVMSKNDMTHGSIVDNEGVILTCISSDRDVKGDGLPGKFVSYMPFDDMREFALKYGLPITDLYVVDKEDLNRFLPMLHDIRDYAEYNDLLKLLSSFEGVNVLKGNVSHLTILGECIEGLVFHKHYADGKIETTKFKFPNYVIRTMVIRTVLQKFEKDLGYGLMPYDVKSKEFTKRLLSKAKEIVPRWCQQESVNFWISFIMMCGNHIVDVMDADVTKRVDGKGMFYRDSDDYPVGIWIIVPTKVRNLMTSRAQKSFKELYDQYKHDPISVFGESEYDLSVGNVFKTV